MINKVIGALFIFVALVGTGKLVFDEFKVNKPKANLNFKKSSIKNRKQLSLDLNQRWRYDFEKLLKEGQLPNAWLLIKEIRFIPADEALKPLVPLLIAPVKINDKGEYALEITLISHLSEQGDTQIIFQHNIIQIINNDMAWELNRTYPLVSKK